MFCFKISFQMRNCLLSAAQGARHSDCIKITDKIKYDVKLAHEAESPAFIETESPLIERDLTHVSCIRKNKSQPFKSEPTASKIRKTDKWVSTENETF